MAYSKSLKENLKALKESKVSDERVFPDTGEVSVVSKTGAYGVRIFIDARAFGGNPTLKLDISASYDGPYTPEAHKERPVDSNNVEKEIKQSIKDEENKVISPYTATKVKNQKSLYIFLYILVFVLVILAIFWSLNQITI